MKVNVWQMGFSTQRDYVLHDNVECREMGFVELPYTEYWMEEVWNFLNWSCWTDQKPKEVHSPLDHCNSDIILQAEGEKKYYAAQFVGWKSFSSLEEAKQEMNDHKLWPFKDAPHRSGHTKVGDDGKAYWISIEDYRADKNNWTEITW